MYRDQSSWMQTYTGRAFYPLDPSAEDVNIEDIAWSLAHQCRFTGHTKSFYSVAEHCYYVSFLVPEEDAFVALLHDASEAYLTDIARPVKQHMPEYKKFEAQLESVIAERFGTAFPMPASVKIADNIMLITEKHQLLSKSPQAWSSDLDEVVPAPIVLSCWTPEEAYKYFMARFHELGGYE